MKEAMFMLTEPQGKWVVSIDPTPHGAPRRPGAPLAARRWSIRGTVRAARRADRVRRRRRLE